MKAYISNVTLGFILTLTSCSGLTNIEDPCVDAIPEICNLIDLADVYIPVCGCDGVTYTNSGHAECIGGVTTWVDGPCE